MSNSHPAPLAPTLPPPTPRQLARWARDLARAEAAPATPTPTAGPVWNSWALAHPGHQAGCLRQVERGDCPICASAPPHPRRTPA